MGNLTRSAQARCLMDSGLSGLSPVGNTEAGNVEVGNVEVGNVEVGNVEVGNPRGLQACFFNIKMA